MLEEMDAPSNARSPRPAKRARVEQRHCDIPGFPLQRHVVPLQAARIIRQTTFVTDIQGRSQPATNAKRQSSNNGVAVGTVKVYYGASMNHMTASLDHSPLRTAQLSGVGGLRAAEAGIPKWPPTSREAGCSH